jgi:hypothetical protein
MLRFLVAGTLRSGAAYTAHVLNRAGIACGHGWVYTPDGVRRYPHIDIVGDAAPLAVPFVADFPGLVLHQVRHPLSAIGSLLGSSPLGNPLVDGPEGAFLARHFVTHGDPVVNAMRFYVEWNSRCERHNGYLRYRIEDFSAGLILRIADLIGVALAPAAAAQAIAGVPTDFNTRDRARRLAWSDLPEGPARDALTRLADRYGYAVAD